MSYTFVLYMYSLVCYVSCVCISYQNFVSYKKYFENIDL